MTYFLQDIKNFEEIVKIENKITKLEKIHVISKQEIFVKLNNVVNFEIERRKNTLLLNYKIKDIIENIHEINQKDIKDSNLNDIEKETILDYCYWKYRNPNCTESINFTKLKKAIIINKAVLKCIVPIIVSVKCPYCGSNRGTFKIYDYEINHFEYTCANCNHTYYNNNSHYISHLLVDNMKKCKCKICNDIKHEIFEGYKLHFVDILEEMTYKLLKCMNEFDVKTISDEQMEYEYSINMSNFTKDEREIISKKPQNIDEIKNIITDILNRPYIKNKNNLRNKLLDNLENHKFIYNISEKIQLDNEYDFAFKLICSLFNKFRNNNIIEIYINALSNNDIEKFFNYYEVIKEARNFTGENNESFYENRIFFDISHFRYEGFKSYFYKEKIIINKYYYEENNIQFKSKSKLLKNLFQSEGEKSAFINLRNKYKDFIIIPKMDMRRIIDFTKVRDLIHITNAEFNYLLNCNLNFVLFDFDGNVCAVIELKKGKHHNEKDWIEKDNLKKIIIQQNGIHYIEEY